MEKNSKYIDKKITKDGVLYAMEKYFWDTQIDYLKETRKQMWNDDYFEFLVKTVWKLNRPINIVDFGCGYGYLGMKLLPLLPEGSTYTGLDIGEDLLSEGRRIFAKSPYKTEFQNVDLTKFIPEQKFDLAICQAVLRHIPSSKDVLKKMIDSVVPNGMVICIEVNRVMEEAGFYSNNFVHDSIEKTTILKQKWTEELENNGRDYKLGIKVPIYMQQLGLQNVGIRINDFVEFVSPTNEEQEYEKHANSILKEKGFKGLQDNNTYALSARCLLISFGYKTGR